MKSKFILLLAVLALISCATPSRRTSGVLVSSKEKPDFSILHVSGKLVRIPANSKWPSSIKVGTPFEYWFVIDNAVKDQMNTTSVGNYPQSGWPARYDLKVGSLRFSSDRAKTNVFVARIRDGASPLADGYIFRSDLQNPLQEAPGLDAIVLNLALRTSRSDIITSDRLPFRPIEPTQLLRDTTPQFRVTALLDTDRSDQSLIGAVNKFEVFQATADTPIGPPVP